MPDDRTECPLQHEIELRRDPESAAAARRFVHRALREAQLADRDEVVVLLANELVTNAILHARSEIRVVVEVAGERVRVEVRDHADRMPTKRTPDATSTAGRGLALIEALASDWGVEPIPGNGKAVWFEVGGIGG